MCGICGFAIHDPSSGPELARLVRMRGLLGHRGPDGMGHHCQDGVGLGHVRLSIIDVATGAQPIANEDESIWITYNGEVYNYPELTAALQAAGHRFRTRSDTETLVHAYEEYGIGFMTRLNGMFAFALHDRPRRRVLLARDHFGIKPLFYGVTAEGLFFGSEIKAVAAGMGISPTLRFESLQEYLLFRSVAGGDTFFEGIHRLPPGHLAVWEQGRLKVEPFWTLPAPDPGSVSAAEAIDRLEGLLADSVESQLMSEVPLGTFCSGGLDSGLVTSVAADRSRHPLKTFSVGFENPAWDETGLATENARYAGTEHHVLIARPATFADALSSLIWHHDEPLSHPNSVPIYFLSRFARQYVTVVLTGEGADELFGGYPRYQIARLSGALDRLPPALRSGATALASHLPGHRARRLGALLPHSSLDAMVFNSAYLTLGLVTQLTGAPIERALDSRRALAAACQVVGDPVASITRYDLHTYLGALLDRMDRMTMASGLEGRVPFLDMRLAEWALRLPSRLKVRGRENKIAIRRLATRRLSPAVVRAPKSGFGVPLAEWFKEPAFADVTARLDDPSHPAAHFFQRKALDRIRGEARAGVDHGDALWLVSNVFLWMEIYGRGGWDAPPPPPEEITARTASWREPELSVIPTTTRARDG